MSNMFCVYNGRVLRLEQSTIRSTREYYATMCPTDRESVSADLTQLNRWIACNWDRSRIKKSNIPGEIGVSPQWPWPTLKHLFGRLRKAQDGRPSLPTNVVGGFDLQVNNSSRS